VKSTKKKTKSSVAAAATKDTSRKLLTKIVSNQTRVSVATTMVKISKTQMKTQKNLNAYEFDWIDSRFTTMEIMKYSKADKID
jgi:hypothetical protein